MEYPQNRISISFWFTYLPFRALMHTCIFNEDIEYHGKNNPICNFTYGLSLVCSESRLCEHAFSAALLAFKTWCSGEATGWGGLHPKGYSKALNPFCHKLISIPSTSHVRCAQSSQFLLFPEDFNLALQPVKAMIGSSVTEAFKEKVEQEKRSTICRQNTLATSVPTAWCSAKH